MRKSKLFLTLVSVKRDELGRFLSFVDSPYFNKRNDLKKFLILLRDAIENDLSPTKIEIYAQLFSDQSYDDQQMRQMMSDLYKLLDRFLAIEEFTSGPAVEKIYGLRAYRKRMLKKQFPTKLTSTQKSLDRHHKRDSDYHRFQHLIEAEHNYYLENLKKRDSDPNLQAALDALDLMYLSSKLKYLCHMLNFKNVTEVEYRMHSVEQILAEVEHSDLLEVPAVAVYYHIYMALTNFEDDEYYAFMRTAIEDHDSNFRGDELRQLFLFCVNYCIKKVLSGKKPYEGEMLKLFKEMIHKGIILEHGYMSPWIYKNATALGLRLDEVDWTIGFLKKYRNKIDPDFKDNVYAYNLARVYFHEEKYSQVIEVLRSVDYNDLFYALDSRALLLKTYYELKEYPALIALANSFNQFIRRQSRLPEAHKNNYLNLVKFTRKAIKASYQGSKAIQKLEQEFNETRQISDRKWISSKILEMK